MRSGAVPAQVSTPTSSSPSFARWRTRPTAPTSRACSTPRAPPTTSTPWPGWRPRGADTHRSRRSTISRSRPWRHLPARTPPARASRRPDATPRRSSSPSPGPQGTTSRKPTPRSATAIRSIGETRTGAATSSCATAWATSKRRRPSCSPTSAARPAGLPATARAFAPRTSTPPSRRWPTRRRWPADWKTSPTSAPRWTSSRVSSTARSPRSRPAPTSSPAPHSGRSMRSSIPTSTRTSGGAGSTSSS